MTYTKGPWVAAPHTGHADTMRWVICGPNYNNRVAVISLNGAPHGDRNIEFDNANLIATAPELLESLEEMFGLVETLANLVDDPMAILRRGGGYEKAEKARAVIAKAKGER